MLRLFVLLAILALVALIVFKLVKGIRGSATGGADASSREAPKTLDDGKLVRCTSCGAFVPREEALAVTEGYRCGEPRCREPPA